MDAKTVGSRIAALRKKSGMTQSALAEQLSVTDKAVSRWESGQGYPDIALFPGIARVFGVTVDYLMQGEQKGIAIAGNMILDIVKSIDAYPEIGTLVNVSDMTYSVGGCAPNTAVNLAKIDRSLPITVLGRVGSDENGRFITSFMRKYGLNLDKIAYDDRAPTSFCDVMSIPSGERTFFHQKGANAKFSPTDIPIDRLDCDLLHIGYILLLDRFDEEDPVYGTVMARFLSEVQKRGIKTSIDMVSDSTADYGKILIPALRYCNYVIINEHECCTTWGLSAYDAEGRLLRENIRYAMSSMMEAGVRDRVIVHCKETGFIMDASGNLTEVPSLDIPSSEIKGSVGAGDAFCAGCLYGIYHGLEDRQMLEFASAAAACNLFAQNAVDGMKSRAEIVAVADRYGRKKLSV